MISHLGYTTRMDAQHINRLENQLERLIEGGFHRLFGRRIHAADLALHLARAMDDHLYMDDHLCIEGGHDPRPIAPDEYLIYLNPRVQSVLLERHAALVSTLAMHLVEMATNAGYRLNDTPHIKLLADNRFNPAQIHVAAQHTHHLAADSTAAMERVEIASQNTPTNPQLIIDQRPAIALNAPLINIGREHDNHIIVDDHRVSRHHLQIRLTQGCYVLFDVNSSGGSYVNDVHVREHRLKSGDVIRIGNTQMIYFDDSAANDPDDQTNVMDPIF